MVDVIKNAMINDKINCNKITVKETVDLNNAILQKLCAKSKISQDVLQIEQTTDTCLICHKSMTEDDSDDIWKLVCKHQFHYQCIFNWYKTSSSKIQSGHNNFKPKTCPYCRKNGGWLPLKDGVTPLKDVHEEYIIPVKPNKKFGKTNHSHCQAFLKTTDKFQHKCNKYSYYVTFNGTNMYCHQHINSGGNKQCKFKKPGNIQCKYYAKYVDDGAAGFKYCGHHANADNQPAINTGNIAISIVPNSDDINTPGKCQAKTKTGQFCCNKAKLGMIMIPQTGTTYPKYCGVHKKFADNDATNTETSSLVNIFETTADAQLSALGAILDIQIAEALDDVNSSQDLPH